MAHAAFDPLARLSWLSRLRWRRAERRIRREFESDTLAELRQLVAEGAVVSWTTSPEPANGAGIWGPVEISAGGRRITARAVWGPAWSMLAAAASQGLVVLTGAGRYSGSWCLRFRILTGEARVARELPLLGAGLRILPHWGGETAPLRDRSPIQPALA
jgi:hypothetical protein